MLQANEWVTLSLKPKTLGLFGLYDYDTCPVQPAGRSGHVSFYV